MDAGRPGAAGCAVDVAAAGINADCCRNRRLVIIRVSSYDAWIVTAPLSCPVRGCERPLARTPRALVCAGGHAFDVARHGHINLLQPADRRSRHAGDSKEAVQARAGLAAAGVGDVVFEQVVERAVALLPDRDAIVVDLGSGSGEALDALSRRRPITGIGIDLSVDAADHAARRFPALTWIVANADRRLPVLTGSVDLALSLNARRNPAECARVLKAGAYLLVSVPAPDDLIELREQVQGAPLARDRSSGVLADHASHFALVERTVARQRQRLEREALLELLRGTYRGRRTSQSAAVDTLDSLEVTIASELIVFRR
jgi:23S rRNA (guanine745-N1)-methyltransferase